MRIWRDIRPAARDDCRHVPWRLLQATSRNKKGAHRWVAKASSPFDMRKEKGGSQSKMTIADSPPSLCSAGRHRRHEQIGPIPDPRRQQGTARQPDKTTGEDVATRFKMMRTAPVLIGRLSEVDPFVTDSAQPESVISVCGEGGSRREIANETGDPEFSLKALE
jgi:hypothetical protein